MIEGVELKALETFPDERGFFRELIRETDAFFREGFAQWSHSMMYYGVIKAWHLHQKQTDWWYLPIGLIKLVLADRRVDSNTRGAVREIFLGEGYPAQIVKIPPGVAHGCKVLSPTAHLFYMTSRIYDPSDEGRLAHDDPTIGYNWLKGPVIK